MRLASSAVSVAQCWPSHVCSSVCQGDIEKLRILERYGADMNQGDYDGRTGELC